MSTFRIDRSHPEGAEIITIMQQLGQVWSQFEAMRTALIQQRTGDGSQIDHYDDVVRIAGYTTVEGQPDDGTVAQASFNEMDAMYGGCANAIQQCVARHKQ